MRRLPRGDAAFHPRALSAPRFECSSRSRNHSVKSFFTTRLNGRGQTSRPDFRCPMPKTSAGEVSHPGQAAWNHLDPTAKNRLPLCAPNPGAFDLPDCSRFASGSTFPGEEAKLARTGTPVVPFLHTPARRTGPRERENTCGPEKSGGNAAPHTGPDQLRTSRFPAGYTTLLPASAPATATTHSSPATGPGWNGSSVSGPGESGLVHLR